MPIYKVERLIIGNLIPFRVMLVLPDDWEIQGIH